MRFFALRQLRPTGEKYYRYGLVLKQVAAFYNNLASEIIESQKPLLLGAAERFEALITNPVGRRGGRADEGVTWSDVAEIESYVGRLQEAVEKLTADNRLLRGFHAQMGAMVVQLLNTNLVTHKETWKTVLKDLRNIVATVVGMGFENTEVGLCFVGPGRSG